ncbi:MAG: E3 binding domain-containing protein, partial [Thermoleophilia bacterium]|nr:E3 binding domain-containing protein [Thermoleophilia bacterium]
MADQVTLPRLGQGMESGTITRWLKSEGERVEKGEPLYELDTEKVTQEVEADASGVLLKILVAEGEVEVGRPVAVIGEEGEEPTAETAGDGAARAADSEETPGRVQPEEAGAEVGAEKPAEGPARESEREHGREAAREAAESEDAAEQPTQVREPRKASQPRERPGPREAPEPGGRDGGRIKASPLARRLAREREIDLSSLQGTGPDGRIVAEDVERAAARPARAGEPEEAPGEVEVVRLTQMRRTIARRMSEAWQTPHFQIAMSADMRAAVALREALVGRMLEGDAKPTISDVLTKACAVALMRHRDV